MTFTLLNSLPELSRLTHWLANRIMYWLASMSEAGIFFSFKLIRSWKFWFLSDFNLFRSIEVDKFFDSFKNVPISIIWLEPFSSYLYYSWTFLNVFECFWTFLNVFNNLVLRTYENVFKRKIIRSGFWLERLKKIIRSWECLDLSFKHVFVLHGSERIITTWKV